MVSRSTRGMYNRNSASKGADKPRVVKPYVHRPVEPPPTYVVDGIKHRTDGRCHPACQDWR